MAIDNEINKNLMNIDEYEITTTLKKDAVYQWVEAVDRNQNNKFILQILRADMPPETKDAIVSYFDDLQAIRRKGIWGPTQMFETAEHPLVLVYPYISTIPFQKILEQTPSNAIEWWGRASERLHVLHNKNIVHGRISSNSFVIDANKYLYLTDFGYAPVLELGLVALPEYQEILAPEVLEQQLVTPAADIYAFAKAVVTWQSKLTTSEWYRRATDINPERRFQRMRRLFENLKEELSIDLEKKEELDIDVEGNDTGESLVSQGDIIPKYILEVKVEPPEAGKIIGVGSYPAAENVSVTAVPSSGWKFEGWSGSLTGAENPTTVIMDDNKSAIASFSKVKVPQKKLFTLTVRIEPTDAGSVSGGGNYETGTQVSVMAKANSKQWRFERWEGDLRGSKNPTGFAIDSHKSVVARFVEVPNIEKESTSTIPDWARSPNISEQDVSDIKSSKQQEQVLSIPKWARSNETSLDAQEQEAKTPPTQDDEADTIPTKSDGETILPSSKSEQQSNYSKTKLGKAFQ